MSYDATDWAMDLPLGNPYDKLVLLNLAHHHNKDTGLCCPSVATIGERTGMKDRGIRSAIKRLCQQGLIAIEGNTHRRRYRLMFHGKLAAPDTATGDRLAASDTESAASETATSGVGRRLTRKQQGNNNLGADAPQPDMLAGKAKDMTKPATTARHGTRLPADWQPPQDQIARIERELPQVDWRAETEKFRDYWIAKPGQHGTKLDWPATWRNWMRNAQRFAPRGGGFGGNGNGAASRGYGGNAAPGAVSDDPWDMRLRAFRERGIWLGEWGPRPGEKGCRVAKNEI